MSDHDSSTHCDSVHRVLLRRGREVLVATATPPAQYVSRESAKDRQTIAWSRQKEVLELGSGGVVVVGEMPEAEVPETDVEEVVRLEVEDEEVVVAP